MAKFFMMKLLFEHKMRPNESAYDNWLPFAPPLSSRTHQTSIAHASANVSALHNVTFESVIGQRTTVMIPEGDERAD